jgi:hypothetical protein
MRGAPHSGFATLISRMSWQISSGVLGRPPRGLDFQRHQARKASAMPSDDGLRLEDFHRVQHLGSRVIEPRKHQAIDIVDGNPLGRPIPEHIELMPKGENFGLQGCARPEQTGHGVPDQLEEITHRGDYQPIRRFDSRFGFTIGTPSQKRLRAAVRPARPQHLRYLNRFAHRAGLAIYHLSLA